jgi:very-short-patch-repair endonuclease
LQRVTTFEGREPRSVTRDAFATSVRLIAADDVAAARDFLRDQHSLAHPERRMLFVSWSGLPAATDQARSLLQRLAEIALRMWPTWYGDSVHLGSVSALPQSDTQLKALLESAGLGNEVSLSWLRNAALACSRKQLPLFEGLAPIDQFRQLALVCGPSASLVISVGGEVDADGRLNGLARLCQLLHQETGFEVTLIVQSELAGSLELDPINYWCQPFLADREIQSTTSPTTAERVQERIADEPAPSFTCPLGKPHPESAGEQALARWLQTDEELGSLFAFNQPIRTVRDSLLRVDLVWEAGKIAVEVDGFRSHTTPHQFRMDRQRDYELTLSGYAVLRLTHQEVMQDVVIAGEKIRDVVRWRLNAERKPR